MAEIEVAQGQVLIQEEDESVSDALEKAGVGVEQQVV